MTDEGDRVGSGAPERVPTAPRFHHHQPAPRSPAGPWPLSATHSCAERRFLPARNGLWREGSVRAGRGQAPSAVLGGGGGLWPVVAAAVVATPRSLGRFVVLCLFVFCYCFWLLFIKIIMKTFSERENLHYDLKSC